MSLASVDRYDPERASRVGRDAVVLGASVAGLLASRVLAGAFDRVILVERDRLDAVTGARRGVPQARHPHALLVAGQVVMEDLFPGFVEGLVASGGLELDFNRDFAMYAAGGFIAPGPAEIPMYFASRPLIERVLRSRPIEDGRVEVLQGSQVIGPVSSDDGEVGGVLVQQDGERRMLAADLIVDATGRATSGPAWLEELGHAPPPREEVHVDLSYRTCQVARPSDDRRAMLLAPSPPHTRGAALVPVEDDRWLVTLVGVHGDHAPGDLDGLREFASSLPTEAVREVLEEQPLVAPNIDFYQFPTQTRHRYERMKDLPAGLLCVGDAIASFNPVYGQGMSVAALEAVVLHNTITDGGLRDLPRRFYRRTKKIVEGAWNIAAGGDFLFEQTRGAKPPGIDLVNRYIVRLQRKAHTDPTLAEEFRRVAGMERSSTSLLRPSIAWQVLRPGQRVA